MARPRGSAAPGRARLPALLAPRVAAGLASPSPSTQPLAPRLAPIGLTLSAICCHVTPCVARPPDSLSSGHCTDLSRDRTRAPETERRADFHAPCYCISLQLGARVDSLLAPHRARYHASIVSRLRMCRSVLLAQVSSLPICWPGRWLAAGRTSHTAHAVTMAGAQGARLTPSIARPAQPRAHEKGPAELSRPTGPSSPDCRCLTYASRRPPFPTAIAVRRF